MIAMVGPRSGILEPKQFGKTTSSSYYCSFSPRRPSPAILFELRVVGSNLAMPKRTLIPLPDKIAAAML
jgi:hypothetical protein